MTSPSHGIKSLGEKDILEYIDIVELSGISQGHKNEIQRALTRYLQFIDWTIDKNKSLKYFKLLMDKCSIAYYKKQMYQIRKFLSYYGCDWVNDIKLPPDPDYTPKRITISDISNALEYFKRDNNFKRFRAIILLGATSGLRAEELYQLNVEDIDLENRIIHINHNPDIGQTTKTKTSRISFFNKESQYALKEYITYFRSDVHLKVLFSQCHITRLFKDAPIQVKDLRKYFSQEWDRLGGPTSIKKILMGHSLKGDVDLMHYNYQSEEDLKKIYDKVMENGTRIDIL